MPALVALRRTLLSGRAAGSTTVNVTASGGVWKFTPGVAGTYSPTVLTLNVAPTVDVVQVDFTGGASYGVACDVGMASVNDPTAQATNGTEVTATPTNLDGGSFTASMTITFTATAGAAVTIYQLQPQAV